jgi:hypothetical protein
MAAPYYESSVSASFYWENIEGELRRAVYSSMTSAA